MDSKEISIVSQTSAKVTAEMIASLGLRTIDEVIEAYDKVFAHVKNSLFTASQSSDKRTKGGRQVPIISQDEIQMRLTQTIQSQTPINF